MSDASLPLQFSARSVGGAGLGRTIGSPTVNLNLDDVPQDLPDGIYAVFAAPDSGDPLPAAMHLGPRPAMGLGRSCEVHVLDVQLDVFPQHMTVDVIAYLRAIETFETIEALRAQIAADIEAARAILSSHVSTT